VKQRYVEAIRQSGLSIYDHIEIDDPELWIPTPELEKLLNRSLSGISLAGLPNRSRSKVLKENVCRALGYPVPKSFKKTQPRFPGQCFDTYGQKKNNLQVWNEELSPIRRYVIIGLDTNSIVKKIKVVTGDTLAVLDKTGTLTQKYQAQLVIGLTKNELISKEDTCLLSPFVRAGIDLSAIGPKSFKYRYPEAFSKINPKAFHTILSSSSCSVADCRESMSAKIFFVLSIISLLMALSG
jgi:hypothetical protein